MFTLLGAACAIWSRSYQSIPMYYLTFTMTDPMDALLAASASSIKVVTELSVQRGEPDMTQHSMGPFRTFYSHSLLPAATSQAFRFGN